MDKFDYEFEIDTKVVNAVLVIGASTVLAGVGFLCWYFINKRKK